jgi:FMN phosphatase YigB (HAD superfamily)
MKIMLERLAMLLLMIAIGAVGFVHLFATGRKTSLRHTTLSNQETPHLALLTFDLDNTLFPVGPVLEDADVAMIRALHSAGCTEATDVSIARQMKQIQKKAERRMSFSEQRKRAIHQEMELITKPGETLDIDFVHTISNVWLDERHRSAERNLFSDTIAMLETIKTKFPRTCIGAITNGDGNPLCMNATLASYFDFCVSGEDSNIFPNKKPQRGIYEASIAAYCTRYPSKLTQDSHIWCHVGDCLVNDVWASSRTGAHAIWIEVDESATNVTTKGHRPSPRNLKTLKKVAKKGLKAVSAKISRLAQLPEAIDMILEHRCTRTFASRKR